MTDYRVATPKHQTLSDGTNTPRFFVTNNACIRRKIDAQHVIDHLTSNGYHEVTQPEYADLIVFVSCAADDVSEAVAVESVKQLAQKCKPTARIIVGGCLPKINRASIEQIEGVIGTFSPRSMSQLTALLPEIAAPFEQTAQPTSISPHVFKSRGLPFDREHFSSFSATKGTNASDHPPQADISKRYERFKKESAIIRIADGCLSECAYCCIRSATGRLSSRPIPDIVQQCEFLLNAGKMRFTLTAEDVGAYGLDIDVSVSSLLDALATVSSQMELAIMALNPRWVIPDLNHFKKALQKSLTIRHVVAPVQAASDHLLGMMQRGHSADDVFRFFDVLKQYGNGLQIHTHLIVGFPGETMADVEASIDLINRYPDIHYYIYPYNDRPGTVSSHRNDKLDQTQLEQRYTMVTRAWQQLCSRATRNLYPGTIRR